MENRHKLILLEIEWIFYMKQDTSRDMETSHHTEQKVWTDIENFYEFYPIYTTF